MPVEEGGDLRSALPVQRMVGKWVEDTHHRRVNLWSSIIGHHRQGVEITLLSIHLAFDCDHTLPRMNSYVSHQHQSPQWTTKPGGTMLWLLTVIPLILKRESAWALVLGSNL